VLQQVGPSALAAHTSALQQPLRHNNGNVRRNALTLLGAFPSDSIAAHTDALRSLLSDPDPLVSKLALELLAQLPIPALADEQTALLEEPGFTGHRPALVSMLGQLSGLAAPSPAALRLLHDADPAVRASAIGTLARLNPSAIQEHAGLLLTALGDSDARVRTSAMEVFAHFPAGALAEHVPVLLPRLNEFDWKVQLAARKALVKVGGSTLAAHTQLLLDMLLKCSVWHGSGWVGIDPPLELVELLPVAATSPYLGWLLSTFGSGPTFSFYVAEQTLRKIISAMSPEDAYTVLIMEPDPGSARKKVALDIVLGRHLPSETLSLHTPLLMELTCDSDTCVQAGAFRTLSKLEPAELGKIPTKELLPGLLHPEPSVHGGAIGALCKLPPDVLAPHAAQVLLMLWDPDSSVRELAMQKAEEMRCQFGATPQLRQQLRGAAVDACNAARDAVAADLKR
jgi:hypothetical protein